MVEVQAITYLYFINPLRAALFHCFLSHPVKDGSCFYFEGELPELPVSLLPHAGLFL